MQSNQQKTNINSGIPKEHPVLVDAIPSHLSGTLKNGIELLDMLSSMSITSDQKRQIWGLMETRIPSMIENAVQFRYLLGIYRDDKEMIARILNELHPHLSRLIITGKELCDILELDCLSNEQRKKLLMGIKHLPHLIKISSQLNMLLNPTLFLPEDILELSNQVLPHIHLIRVIKNFSDLYNLLSCPQLNDKHLTFILRSLENNLPWLMRREADKASLLKLSFLSDEHQAFLKSVPPYSKPTLAVSSPNLFFPPPSNPTFLGSQSCSQEIQHLSTT